MSYNLEPYAINVLHYSSAHQIEVTEMFYYYGVTNRYNASYVLAPVEIVLNTHTGFYDVIPHKRGLL